MIKREQWGAKPLTKYTNTIKPGARTRIVIHHSVTSEGANQAGVEAILRRIDDQHRNNGWGGIGYNIAVDSAGRVYEARGIDIHGAHASGSNIAGYGIVYIGDGRKNVSAEAVKAIRNLVIELQARSLKKLEVVGHHQVNRTECPGPLLIAELTKGTFNVAYPLVVPKPPVAPPVAPKPPVDENKYVVVRPGDSYWRIAVRVLNVPNTVKHYPAIIKESNRIQTLNNKKPLVPGQRVRIK
jgi:LysM repeat protein